MKYAAVLWSLTQAIRNTLMISDGGVSTENAEQKNKLAVHCEVLKSRCSQWHRRETCIRAMGWVVAVLTVVYDNIQKDITPQRRNLQDHFSPLLDFIHTILYVHNGLSVKSHDVTIQYVSKTTIQVHLMRRIQHSGWNTLRLPFTRYQYARPS